MPHRLILSWFLLTFIALSSWAQDDGGPKKNPFSVPCARYWQGHMKYTEEPYTGIKIIRKGKKHTEINPETQCKSTFKIEWTGDCSYTLTFKKSTIPTRFKKGWMAEVEITQAYEEYYEFKSDLHGIVSYGIVQKELSPQEKKMKIKMEQDSIKQAIKDSIRIATGDTIDKKAAKRDSIAAAKAADPKKSGDPAKVKEGERGKESGKEKESGKAEEKPKKEKTSKEKKEKAPKEKKEKVPKEKKEKAPKEKKEKVPKEEE